MGVAEAVFDRVLAGRAPGFALLHRPRSSTGPHAVEVIVGQPTTMLRLAELPVPVGSTDPCPGRIEADGGGGAAVLAAIPYRQIVERGYACRDDHEPIRAIPVEEHSTVPVAEALRRLPDTPVEFDRAGFDVDDRAYAELTRRVLAEEIGQGEGANFVIKRAFTATIADYSTDAALAIFRRLLTAETGAYWTFVMCTGDRTLVGATPERHATLADETVVMNPISGTYRYPASGPRLDEVMTFLADRKEADELFMVVDEELKMMARVCHDGGRVVGPYLREMARLAHTEYLIEGHSELDARDILRATMFAPTVTGSPIENACRVIARHEPDGRGYYSGVLALLGRDGAGRQAMDSAILIRAADITARGRLSIGVGATLVRLSDPDSEVAETRAKAASMLAALGLTDGVAVPSREVESIAGHPAVRTALRERNRRLSRFWLQPASARQRAVPHLAGRRVLVLDAEDTFTAMLEQQLGTLGLEVVVRPYRQVPDPRDFGLVILGPGPGDPTDGGDPKIAELRRLTRGLLRQGIPLLAVCLGHQVLADQLGLELVRRDMPNQGVQLDVDLFGRHERVGFYNTFAARCDHTVFADPYGSGTVRVSREPAHGEVHALRGARFASVQFHPESLLTQNGPAILRELVEPLLDPEPALPHPGLPVFLREFLRHPARTGAVAPSSRWLARRAVCTVPERGDPVVVELGPGTGSFTSAIHRRLWGRGQHIAIELNPRFADLLRHRFPDLDVVTGDAADLPKVLADRGLGRADVIVSALPWSVFPGAVQRRLMDAIRESLADGGALTAFAYLHAIWSPPARRFRALLREAFDEVLVGRTVWSNPPPALVYTARRPRERR
nr:chorismate-binding protein [Plantactinospora alkalitolerans]